MLRLARLYVPSQAVAEEVVQETWLAVLGGLERPLVAAQLGVQHPAEPRA
jgi:DNA-directed RNA polymerase specialized sigma24 family protein